MKNSIVFFLVLFLAACILNKDSQYYASLYFDEVVSKHELSRIKEDSTMKPVLPNFLAMEEILYGKFKGYELVTDSLQTHHRLLDSYRLDDSIYINPVFKASPKPFRPEHKEVVFLAKVFYERASMFTQVKFIIESKTPHTSLLIDNFSDKKKLSTDLPHSLLLKVNTYLGSAVPENNATLYDMYSPILKKMEQLETVQQFSKKWLHPEKHVKYFSQEIKQKELLFYRSFITPYYVTVDKVIYLPVVSLYYKIKKPNSKHYDYLLLMFSYENEQFYLFWVQGLS